MTSQVILLTNMVGPGEVDDMLQEETADECSKYGKVERCLIFEVNQSLSFSV
jgi:splicing factor 45